MNVINEQENQSDDHKRIYSRVKNEFGEERCFVSGIEKISEYSLSETLAGRRVLLGSITPIKNLLANRYKEGESCGFHISSTITNFGYSMLFNKRFDDTFRRKIDNK
jgi:hypothetical protein